MARFRYDKDKGTVVPVKIPKPHGGFFHFGRNLNDMVDAKARESMWEGVEPALADERDKITVIYGWECKGVEEGTMFLIPRDEDGKPDIDGAIKLKVEEDE